MECNCTPCRRRCSPNGTRKGHQAPEIDEQIESKADARDLSRVLFLELMLD